MPDTCPDLDHDWSTDLVDLLQRQERIVDDLAALADRQAELIESRRTDALLALLTERQRLIDDFGAAQEALGGMGDDLTRRASELETERRTHVQQLIERIGARLAVVMEGDARDQARLEASRTRVASEVAATGTARQVHAAYRGPRPSANRFTDERG